MNIVTVTRYDSAMTWKLFLHYWQFVRGIQVAATGWFHSQETSNAEHWCLLCLQPVHVIRDFLEIWEALIQRQHHDDIVKWKHFPHYWPFVRPVPVPVEFPSQRPVTQNFNLCLNKCLSKQSWRWWFEMLSRSLWHHRNVASALVQTTSAHLRWIRLICAIIICLPIG